MAVYGVQTWDANGVVSNYGIKPVSVIGYNELAKNQQVASFTYVVPVGCKLNFYQVNNVENYDSNMRRRVYVSGNKIIVEAINDTTFGADTFPAVRSFIIAVAEKI